MYSRSLGEINRYFSHLTVMIEWHIFLKESYFFMSLNSLYLWPKNTFTGSFHKINALDTASPLDNIAIMLILEASSQIFNKRFLPIFQNHQTVMLKSSAGLQCVCILTLGKSFLSKFNQKLAFKCSLLQFTV